LRHADKHVRAQNHREIPAPPEKTLVQKPQWR
jgi:hypothetical protein